MAEFLAGLGPWHWLALALALLGIELLIGTFDLLWIAAAALIAAVYSILPLPEGMQHWTAHLVVFAISSVVLLFVGRRFVKKSDLEATTHETLNRRTDALIGKSATAVADFRAGAGRVKVGDTEWSARAAEGVGDIKGGDTLKIVDAESTTLIVEPQG